MNARRAVAALGVAVVAVSFGAPLARLTEAAPLAVAMWRMVFATAILMPVVAAGGGLRIAPRHRPAALLAGCCLGLHFGLWIPSLWLTSVSASVVLVATAPLWVLLASPRLLGVPVRGRNVLSFAVALAGVAVIGWGDVRLSWRALSGDLLALGGAVAVAGYIVMGKRVRGELPLAPYLAAVNAVAAVVLVGAVAGARVAPFPRTGVSWLFLLAMAAGPTLIGHTLLNWALAHLEAYRVNLAVLLEPVLASLWTWLLLAEAPPPHVFPGAALVIAALALEYTAGSHARHDTRGGDG
ncbi:MAG: DMT family transporter [Acidobacteriota bacterium]